VEIFEKYIRNTEGYEENLNLANYYYDAGHMSPAISFYLRAAERTDNDINSYTCLLRCFLAFDKLQGRHWTCLNMLQRAIDLLPKRPEAYFLYARYHERKEEHQLGYTQANIGLNIAQFDLEPLPLDVQYPGMYGLLFEKSVCAYWWGKGNESRKLHQELVDDYWDVMDDVHKKAVKSNMERIGMISPEGRDTDIIIQGPYRKEYTAKLIDKCLKLSFVNNVIVSYWYDDNAQVYNKSRVTYLNNRKPDQFGTDNRNLQIVSTQKGLEKVTSKYCVKMRSDQEYDLEGLYEMREHYEKEKEDYPNAIFVGGVFPKLLFHPRDHLFWGTTEQIKALFDVPLEIDGFGAKNDIPKDQLAQHYSEFVRSETYLGSRYIARFDSQVQVMVDQPEQYLHDNSEKWSDAHQKSQELLLEYFRPFSKNLSMFWHSKDMYYPYENQKNTYGEVWSEDLEKKFESFMVNSSINHTRKPSAWIIDNFYEDPDSVRKFALQQEFDEGEFGELGRGYIGRRTFKQFLFPGLKERFEQIMGTKIERWEEYGMNGRFQVCYAGEPLVYHCDAQRWAGMLYLTPDAPYNCGTTLYAHKETRVRHNSHPDIMKTFAHNEGGGMNLDRTPYEPVDVLGNVYNRLVLFDAGCIHSASEYFGFNYENSRLWQMFFFD